MRHERRHDTRSGSTRTAGLTVMAVVLCLGIGFTVAEDGATSSWTAAVMQQIAESEYHVSSPDETLPEDRTEAWQAPNRAQGFRTHFRRDGIRLVPRVETAASWELGLSLTGLARGASVESAPAPRSVDVDDSRIALDRGVVVEWYVNDRDGLEQGFTLPTRVGDPSSTEPLQLEISISGSLVPRFSEDGQAVDFVGGRSVATLRYAKLVVVDATGDRLPARMEGFTRGGAGGIRIVVDDSYAVYPLVIDPLMTSASWTSESNQVDARFGVAVATAGDINGDGYSDVIVGAHLFDNGETDEGSAFVYYGSLSGLSLVPDWSHDSDEPGAELGFSVHTAGDVNGDGYSDVIVGCTKCDVSGLQEGRALVFHGSGTGLSATPDWTGDGDQGGMDYGSSVAAAGDVNGDGFGDVIVGAPFRNISGTDEGRAYLYYGSSTGVTTATVQTYSGTVSFEKYGSSVSGAGDLNADGFADFAVGAPGADGTFIDEGAVSIFLGQASAPLHFSDLNPANQTDARFGTSVAAAGDVNGDGYADLIAGAPAFGVANEGRAYVYLGNAGGVDIGSPWTRDGGSNGIPAGMLFGSAVATAGDVNGDGYADVVVGAPDFTDDNINPKGGAFVFFGSAAGLDSAPAWDVTASQYNSKLGETVGTAGDINGDGYSDVILGARLFNNPEADEGRAYAYLGSAAGLSPFSSWSVDGDAQGDLLGFSVASAGDVNGDGYADVIVGAPNFDAIFFDAGHARVYHGSATGLAMLPAWDTNGDAQNDRLGYSVASAGDVNGDGYSDVIVGVPGRDAGANSDAGEARVFHGSSLGLPSSIADWSMIGTHLFAQFGHSVAAAGDVNGDGIGDVIIGEPFRDTTVPDGGRAVVYQGTAGVGLTAASSWSAEGNLADGRYGTSVASAGDVNGDGFSDVIVGEPTGCSTCGPGTAYVYLGTGSGVAGVPAWSDDGGTTTTTSYFGFSVGSAGDVNGDGYSDIIVGNYVGPPSAQVRVYHGSQYGLSVPADWQASGQSNSSRMGYSVASAGDVNGDGFADVIAGEPEYDGTLVDEGRFHVWLGSASGLATVDTMQVTGDSTFARLGLSVASAGDVNGDGYADVIVGMPGANSMGTNTGKSLLYYGNAAEGAGVALLPRQMRADNSAAVHQLGEAPDPTSFLLRLYARSPFGRGRVRLESEVKAHGTQFNGNGVQSPAGFADSGGPAFATLSETVGGLTSGEIYHWRVRLDYDSVTQPLAPAGRWLTMPWNGWEEADLRTDDGALGGSGVVPDDPTHQLLVGNGAAGSIQLDWGDSCSASDDDFAIYSGTIGCFASHVVETCSTGGASSFTVPDVACVEGVPPDPCQPPEPVQPPDPCRQFFLVAPVNTTDASEGSIGFDSRGLPRSPGRESCFSQSLDSCIVATP